jgi:hypothetical protein
MLASCWCWWREDAALARNLVRSPGSAVLHNVGLYLGAGFVF